MSKITYGHTRIAKIDGIYPPRRTEYYAVEDAHGRYVSHNNIGTIEWDAGSYRLFPSIGATFSAAQMSEIADFIGRLMTSRRRQHKIEKLTNL